MKRKAPYRYRALTNSLFEKGEVLTFGSVDALQTSFDGSYHRSEMTDTLGFRRCLFNPCQHNKTIYQALKPIKSVSALPVHNWELQFTGAYPRATNLLTYVRGVMPPEPEYSNWLADLNAMWNTEFREAIADQVSILNAVIELLEMLNPLNGKAVELESALRSALEQFWQKLRETGNAWLAFNFALKPMLKDLEALLKMVDTVKRRLNFLKHCNHKPIVVHRRAPERTFEFEETFGHEAIRWPTCDPMYTFAPDLEVRVKGYLKVKPTGWAQVQFDINDILLGVDNWLINFMSFVLALADAAWYLNPLKIVWEAMPFSWLGDWASRRADIEWRNEAFDLTPFKRAKIIQEGRTLSFEWTVTSAELHTPSGEVHDLGIFSVKSFLRRPGPFEAQDTPWRVPSSWYNLSILGAIGIQGR